MSGSYLAMGGPNGTQLWVVTVNADGTASGTELVNTYPNAIGSGSAFEAYGSLSAASPYFTPFGGGFLFAAYGRANENASGYGPVSSSGTQTGRELWYTNGTAAGTRLLYDTYTGTHPYDSGTVGNSGISGSPDIFVLNSSTVLFEAIDRSSALSAAHTYLFVAYSSGGGNLILPTGVYSPSQLTELNSKALFTADKNVNGGQISYLFVTDGTATGTTQITGPGGAPLPGVTLFGPQVNPAGTDTEALFTDSSNNLWATDGTTTTELASSVDIGDGSIGLSPTAALFFVSDVSGALDLWVTNGTPGGTYAIRDGVSAASAVNVGSTGTIARGSHHYAFFETTNPSTPGVPVELWVSGGTAATTFEADSNVGTLGADAAGSNVVFRTEDANSNYGVSAWDGPATGTVALESTGLTFFTAGPTGQVIFTETAGSATTLYATDGTASGTRSVLSGASSFASGLTAFGDVFFTANNAAGVNELFVLGASGPAHQLNIGTDYNPGSFQLAGSELFFNATTADGSTTDTWITNGTDAGTHLVSGGALALNFSGSIGAPPCFLAGTPILTARGEVPVEELRVGDQAWTMSGKGSPLKTIIWVGRSRFDATRHPHPEHVIPIRITAGALGKGLPTTDLLVSPGHAMFLDGVLIQAERLVNGVTIFRDETIARGTYFHVELDQHAIVISAGAPSESYLDTGNRAAFANGASVVDLHPDFSPKHWTDTCVPLIQDGELLTAAKARLLRQARAAGYRTTDKPDLHISADGQRIAGRNIGARTWRFTIPTSCSDIRLMSRSWVPGEVQAESRDTRRLGVLVRRLTLDGVALPLADARLADGWHALEHDGTEPQRWTTGAARLPAGTRKITVMLGGAPIYWQAAPDRDRASAPSGQSVADSQLRMRQGFGLLRSTGAI